MPTTIVNFFSNARYEDVLAETDRFLRSAPASTTALHLKAQAHYQLGEYEDCIALLERTIVYLAGNEPLGIRLQLAALLANALIELGRYEEAWDLVTHAVPADSTSREEYGELLLASAWAAYFQGLHTLARQATQRVFEVSGHDFTCGRGALCAALAAQREGEAHRSKAYLMKAQHHLDQSQACFGNPIQVRDLFLVQVQIARRGTSEMLPRLLRETESLPAGSRIAAFLRNAVGLYHSHCGGQARVSSVIRAVATGVKRSWLALLPGAGERLIPEPAEAPAPRDDAADMALPMEHLTWTGPMDGEDEVTAPVEAAPPAEAMVGLDEIPAMPGFPTFELPFSTEEPAVAIVSGGTRKPVAPAQPVKPVAAPPPPAVPLDPLEAAFARALNRRADEAEESLSDAEVIERVLPPLPLAPPPAPAAPAARAPSPPPRPAAPPARPAAPIVRIRSERDATPTRVRIPQAGTVLLVEPTPRISQAFETCLRDSSFRVASCVPDVETALEEYLTVRPTLVVVDLHSRGVSGDGPPGAPTFVNRFLSVDPHCRIVTIWNAQTRGLVKECLRRGARADLEQPFDRARVLDTLTRAQATRSPVEAMRVPTLELRRPVACSWKFLESGIRSLLADWHPFVARTIDPMGLETHLDVIMDSGTIVRLNIEVPGGKPIQAMAEVVACKEEKVLHYFAVRFSFLKLTQEARERLVSFLMEARGRSIAERSNAAAV